MLRIRIYYYADPDQDPGSKKCPYGPEKSDADVAIFLDVWGGNDGLVLSMDNFEYISELNHGNIFIFKIISLNRTKTIPVQDFTFHNNCYDHIFLITFSFTPP